MYIFKMASIEYVYTAIYQHLNHISMASLHSKVPYYIIKNPKELNVIALI